MLGSNFDLSKEIAKIAEARERAARPIAVKVPADEAPMFVARQSDIVDTFVPRDDARDIRPRGLASYFDQLT